MKKLATSLLILCVVILLFDFHQQKLIFSEDKNCAASQSGYRMRRTVRDYQGGLLDEGLIQQSSFKNNTKQNRDSVQNSTFNFD